MNLRSKNSIRVVIFLVLIFLIASCSETSTSPPTITPEITPSPISLSMPSGTGGGVIAFSSDRNRGQMDLYLINADGSELTQITYSSDEAIAPTWSPDGSKLAFLISKFNQLKLAVISLDSVFANPSIDHTIILVEGPVEASPPAWSHTGNMLFYAAEQDENIDLYKIDIDGNNKVQITTSDYREKHPSVSPDGTKFVYSSDQSGSFDLYLIDNFDISDIQNQTPIQITFGEGDELYPDWSPGGKQILFTTTHNGNKDISVYDLENGTTTTIMESAADEWKASWSPDSNQLVFSFFNFDNTLNDLYIYNLENGSSIPITEDNFDNWWPAWKP